MRAHRFGVTVVVGFLGVLWLAPAAAAGQALYDKDHPRERRAPSWQAEKMKRVPFEPSRTPWGEPDFRGTYDGVGISSDSIEAIEWQDAATPPGETFISDPADGKVPYQPWALAVRDAHRAGLGRGWQGETPERLHVDPQTFCVTTVPRMAWRGNFQILQTPGFVFINLEWGHYYRVIPTNARPNDLADAVKLSLGRSRGRWEGNTLVVEVTNLDGRQWLDSVGNFFSDTARITERWTLLKFASPDRYVIDYAVTIDDPRVYTRPWTMNVPLTRNEKSAEPWEHACHEGEKDLQNVRDMGFKPFRPVVPPASR